MTSAKKITLNGDSEFLSTISKLRMKGYSTINFYFSGSKRHTINKLEQHQILIIAFRYHPRPDKEKSKVSTPEVQVRETTIWYTCKCGKEFNGYDAFAVHAKETGHYYVSKATR